MEQTRPVALPRLIFLCGLIVTLSACGLLWLNRLIGLAAVTPPRPSLDSARDGRPKPVEGRPLPDYGAVPAFALTDQDRGAMDAASLRGHVWVADFIFTTCPGQCLLMTDRFAQLQRAVREPSVRFVSITVDPAHDTPEALAAYAAQHGADPRWRLLTGDPAVIRRLCREGFRLSLDDASAPITHSMKLVLVDPDGEIRGYYEADDAAALGRLRQDLARLLKSRP